MEFTAELIAGYLGGEIAGDPKAVVTKLAKIEEGEAGALAFLANPKYEHYIYDTKATIVIVNRSFEPTAPVAATMIRVDDAYSCFAKLLELYVANKPRKKGVSPLAAIDASATLGDETYVGEFAVIGANVRLGKNCQIYPHVYVGDNVRLGDNVQLFPGVKIYEQCEIGDNVTIHAGSVIGIRRIRLRSGRQGCVSQDSANRQRPHRERCRNRRQHLHRPGDNGFDGHPPGRQARQPDSDRP